MVSTKEAAGLDYLTYKRTLWSRLVQFWREHLAQHPDDAQAKVRLSVCMEHYLHWHARAAA